MTRRAFFFPHAFRPNPKLKLPSRFAFDVQGNIVSMSGSRFGNARILADGYADNTVGTNQDPCVFSAPLGPIHSFCRIDSGKLNDRVKENSNCSLRGLPNCLSEGDVIFYGKFVPAGKQGPTQNVWVDTVIVVQRVVQWPTDLRSFGTHCNNLGACKHKKFHRRSPNSFAHILSTNCNSNCDAYRYNLADAEPNGMHCCTSLDDYRVIIGTVEPTSSALRFLATSFVPIISADKPVSVGACNMSTDDWDALSTFVDEKMRPNPGPYGSWIAELPTFNLAGALAASLVRASANGEVAVPPLRPNNFVRRHDPREQPT
jgi:hypothetical protein